MFTDPDRHAPFVAEADESVPLGGPTPAEAVPPGSVPSRRAPAGSYLRADAILDAARRTVARAGRPIELTRKEFGVLEVLLAARGGVVSSEELLDRVWDENADPFTTTVRVTVMTLRRKLGEPGLVETVVGAGYRVPAAAGDAAAAG